ncbi:MAG: hypothetical protein B7Z10_04275 [Rhodobacterales bacterium 32-66-7]|nr:MAG: hypothetical protein B7Z10_04275 [Rhodobacterales bacterium 32-66-7]
MRKVSDACIGGSPVDLQLLKTFQEVAATGSFAAAAGRLFVTQSAVSLRVQRLEDELGRSLFSRDKAGVVLTPAGQEFRNHATTILRNWEEARQKVSAVDSVTKTLSIAADASFWPRLGFPWLDRLRRDLPDIHLRTRTAAPDALVEMVLSGGVHVLLSHRAQVRPGLVAEALLEDHLVMVSPWPDATVESITDHYAMVDWGSDFQRFHDEVLPTLAGAKLSLGPGLPGDGYLQDRPFAAYLPASDLRKPMDQGRLFPVRDAPSFAHPSWVIWREDMDPGLRAVAARTLSEVVEPAKRDSAKVIQQVRSSWLARTG